MEFLKNLSSKAWAAIAAVIAIILVVFERRKVDSLTAELQTATADKTEAVLVEKQANVEVQIAHEVQVNEDEHKEHLTNEELTKELNKI